MALNAAGFEAGTGSQQRLLDTCQALANRSGAVIVSGLPWDRIPDWLAGAAVVIVPSLAETFGLVALEAMASATPVIAFDIDNLPALIGGGGLLVPRDQGQVGLWRAAKELLGEPLRYAQASWATYDQAQDYRPAHVADLLVKVAG